MHEERERQRKRCSMGKRRRAARPAKKTRDTRWKQATAFYQAQEQRAHKRKEGSKHCGAKIGYATRAVAHGALGRLRAKHGAGVHLRAYHCRFCGLFHCGNPPPRKAE